MVDQGETNTIVTPEQVQTEYAAKQRRLRKPTIGEVEDAMNDFARQMLERFGPLAVELRTLRLQVQAMERKLSPVVGEGGDAE